MAWIRWWTHSSRVCSPGMTYAEPDYDCIDASGERKRANYNSGHERTRRPCLGSSRAWQ